MPIVYLVVARLGAARVPNGRFYLRFVLGHSWRDILYLFSDAFEMQRKLLVVVTTTRFTLQAGESLVGRAQSLS